MSTDVTLAGGAQTAVTQTYSVGGTFRYFTYDGFGRLRQIKNHDNTVVQAFGYTYSRTAGNGWVFQPSSPNAVVDTTFLQAAPTVQATVSTGYLDGLGRAIQIVVRDGASYHVTVQQYDAMGREWRAWKPYTRTSAGYDASFATNAASYYETDLNVTSVNPYIETQYTSDALDRPRRIVPEFIGSTATDYRQYTYGNVAADRWVVTEDMDEAGKVKHSYRDILGNERRVVLGYGSPDATTTNLNYDALGRRTQLTDPRGLVTTYTWNTRGLQVAKTSPDAGMVRHAYDAAGNTRYSQDANQAAAGQVFFTTYDFANRPLVSGQAAATFAALDPDAAASFEGASGNWLVVNHYDAKPSSGTPWNAFSSQLNAVTLDNVAGRLAAVASKSNGAWQIELFSYDSNGRVANRYVFTQNNAGTGVLAALSTSVTYAYDLRGMVTRRSLAVGAETFDHWYDYDARGLLGQVFSSTGPSKPAVADITFAYRPSGEIGSRQFQGGPAVPLRYTIREQLAQIGEDDATLPFVARYAYHPNGTVSEASFYSPGSPAAYKTYRYQFGVGSYDALNRLTSADYSHWTGTSWTNTAAHDLAGITYDASGNIKTLQRYRENGTLIDNLTYGYAAGSNRLSSISEAAGISTEPWDAESGSFSYDANGNLKTAPAPYAITAATYDHRNLPLAITAEGVQSLYRYNHEGQRIAKQVGTGGTRFSIMEGPTLLAFFTLDAAGLLVNREFRLLAGDQVFGRFSGTNDRRYYHTDLLGSVRAAVHGTTIYESFDYDPWGVLMPGRTLAVSTANRELFTGKERDGESDLDYFGARFYMSAIGRWSTVDPPADSFPSWSPYNYVYNNPATHRDPSGRCVVPPLAIACWQIAAAGGALITSAYAASHPESAEAVAELAKSTANEISSAVADIRDLGSAKMGKVAQWIGKWATIVAGTVSAAAPNAVDQTAPDQSGMGTATQQAEPLPQGRQGRKNEEQEDEGRGQGN